MKKSTSPIETKPAIFGFSGFYYSKHDDKIESMLDSYYSDELGNLLNTDSIDIPNKAIRQKYAEKFCEYFADWIKEEFDRKITLLDVKVLSPKEYNFSTDKIECNINVKEIRKLNALMLDNSDFLKFLSDRTTLHDGYRSFYSFNQAVANKDGVLIEYVLEYLAEQYEDGEFDSDYDRQCMYELLHHIDMPQLDDAAA